MFMHVPQFCTLKARKPEEDKTPYLSLLSVVMHSFPGGSARAASNNHRDHPIIGPSNLSNEADLLVLADVRVCIPITMDSTSSLA
ncbi:hypothetical protein FRC03_006864 [Tulasnella sp. 419]|nr:hypothetical protein FRC03_006864 [Tulasnella sp. 419]